MLFSGVILEGVAGSGKSSVLGAVRDSPAFRGLNSSVVLSEHHTQRVLEGCGPRSALRVRDNVELLRSHVDYLKGLVNRLSSMQRWRERELTNPRLSIVLERFHLTHVSNYEHLAWEDVESVDGELAALGFHIVVLSVNRADLRLRLRQRGEDWAGFLAEEGQRQRLQAAPDLEQQVDYFMRQQDALLALGGRSRLASTVLDTSVLSAAEAGARVLALLGLGEG